MVNYYKDLTPIWCGAFLSICAKKHMSNILKYKHKDTIRFEKNR